MMKLLQIISFLLFSGLTLYGQEICDNGIDDDGDGMIDLNDPDCSCSGMLSSVTSLIPNPSFEDTLCCPSNHSQMECAASWIQASIATSDYFNFCGLTNILGSNPPVPLPGDGRGYAGFYAQPGWQEMIGACLGDTVLKADTSYRINLYLAKVSPQASPLVISIYGTTDCNDLPWNGTDCPVGFGSWSLLAMDTVEFAGASWKPVTLEFTPPQNIYALAIGGPCRAAGNVYRPFDYYYIDELTLASAAQFDYNIRVEASGKWCTDDLALHARIDLGGGSWQWYRSGIALPGETSASLHLMTYGTEEQYTAIYSLNGECVRIDHRVDTTDPANRPRVLQILNNDTIVCEGSTIPILAEATPGYHFQWSPAIGVSDPHALSPEISTSGDTSIRYTLTAGYPGCPDTSQSLWIEVDSQYVVSYQADPEAVCAGRPVFLYPNIDSNAESLLWHFPDQERLEPDVQGVYQHAFEAPGVYPVTLRSTFRACPDTSYTDSIRVYALPEVDLGSDSSICLNGQPVYLKNLREAPLGPYHQVWSTGDTTEVLKVVYPGTYTLSVTTEAVGCTTTETIEITKDCYIDVPNAFTPDGDGSNDYFFPRRLLTESLTRFHMQVFNRWGEMVFETDRLDGRGWDGRFNDKVQPMGVYVYRIEADFANGRNEAYEGNVTLIR